MSQNRGNSKFCQAKEEYQGKNVITVFLIDVDKLKA